VESGGVVNLNKGESQNDLIKGGAVQNVYGGKASSTTIQAEGKQIVKGGEVDGVEIAKDGLQDVEGGQVNGVNINGVQNINGGTVTKSAVYKGGVQNINKGSVDTVDVFEYSTQNINGGTVKNVFVAEKSDENIKGGTLDNVLMHGVQNVEGGTVTNTNVFSEGVQNVNGGQVKDTKVSGVQNIEKGKAENSTIYKGGQQIVTGGEVTGTVLDGGVAAYKGGTISDTTLNDGTIDVTNGTVSTTTVNNGTLNLEGGNINGITVNDGIVDIKGSKASAATINNGTINLESGSIDGVTLKDGIVNYNNAAAAVKDVTMTGGTMNLAQNGGNYTIGGDFEFNGGTLNMTSETDKTTNKATYGTLTIDNLKGHGGNLVMDTDFASQTNGDKVTINNADKNAGGTIQVYDKSFSNGKALTEDKKLLLVTDKSGNTNWTSKDLDDGGLWDVTPTLQKIDNNWYLTGETKKTNVEVQTVTTNADADFDVWNNTLTDNTLHNRLSELRLTDKGKSGVWVKAKVGQLAGNNYEGNYQTYNMGFDVKKGNNVYGFAVDYTKGNSDTGRGTGDAAEAGLNLYTASFHPTGAYSDFNLRAGRIHNTMKSYGGYADSASWNDTGYSLSYELGKDINRGRGWYVEPSAQITLGRIQGSSYATDKGIAVNRNGMNLALGRVGVALGRKINAHNDYYLKLDAFKEMSGNSVVGMKAPNGDSFTKEEDHKDGWFELDLGTNVKISKTGYFYGDVSKSLGGNINKKWQVNAGLRFTF
jgi:outer membrane autotransporter protein